MKNYLLILVFLYPQIITSQNNWFEDESKWIYSWIWAGGQSIEAIEVLGDTLIDGINCRIIKRVTKALNHANDEVTIYEYPNDYLYQSGDSILIYEIFEGFKQLYNFELSQGDTLLNDYLSQDMELTFVIDSVGTIVLNDNPLNIQYVGARINSNLESSFEIRMIEKIGSINNHFYWSRNYTEFLGIADLPESDLRCYSDELIGDVNFTNAECDYLPIPTNVLEKEKREEVDIFPNPFVNELSIMTPLDNSYELKIFNSKGKLVKIQELNGPLNTIRTNEFPRGVYFIAITNLNNKKVIRQELKIKN